MIYKWQLFNSHDLGVLVGEVPAFLTTRLSQLLYARRFLSDQAVMSPRYAWPSLNDIEDPASIPELMQGAEVIEEHLSRGGSACIFSDYDVDGICGGVLLYQFLRTAYPQSPIELVQSDRFSEGYGLHTQHVEKLSNFNCIVTVDCGSSSVRAAEQLQKLGCNLVITDHHECALNQEGQVVRPPCQAFINPKRPDGPHYYQFLSGTGVVLMLCIALRRVSEACRPVRLTPFLDLACISVISDSVPLINENRLFVQYGLKLIAEKPRPFFQTLLDQNGRLGEIDEYTLSFSLIPKLNAPGRLGKVDPIVTGLLSNDPNQILGCVRATLDLNQSRMDIQQHSWEVIQSSIRNQMDQDVFCIFHPDVHEGVMGILASRVSEKYHKPTLILTPSQNAGEIKGSGRTYGPHSVYEVLQGCSGLFKQFGGHQAAVGFTLPESNLPAMLEAMTSYKLQRHLPFLPIEAEITMEDVSLQSAQELQKLGPYGQQFPKPVFVIRNVSIPKISLLKGEHLKGHLESENKQKVEFVAWKLGHIASQLPAHQRYDVAFKLKVNTFLAVPRIQAEVVDLERVTSVTN
jgi:single-stranded-DNA-specific exonuclease